jgi:hypothetical protein
MPLFGKKTVKPYCKTSKLLSFYFLFVEFLPARRVCARNAFINIPDAERIGAINKGFYE